MRAGNGASRGAIEGARGGPDGFELGFERREAVTIPPLSDMGQFDAMQQARAAMGPNLSKSAVAERYREKEAA